VVCDDKFIFHEYLYTINAVHPKSGNIVSLVFLYYFFKHYRGLCITFQNMLMNWLKNIRMRFLLIGAVNMASRHHKWMGKVISFFHEFEHIQQQRHRKIQNTF
jgi:hypothetical protein